MLQLRKTLFILSTILFAFAFMGTPAAAQTNCGFDSWDANDDSGLDDDEFYTALSEEGYFDEWDADADGVLDEEEWTAGTEEYFVDYDSTDYQVFADWDLDSDGEITEEEFNDGLFDTVDSDDNDKLGQDEWDLFDVEEDGLFC